MSHYRLEGRLKGTMKYQITPPPSLSLLLLLALLLETLSMNVFDMHIRASVDALCRDGTSEISRDPRTKRLQTRRESLARPSKHTNNNLLDSYLAVHKPSSFLPASSLPRENPLTRDFHNFRVIIFIIIIRASVDALCRDGTSEISRDPRTKRLQTRRESLARPSKHTNNNLLDSYLAVHKPSSFLPASSLPRENPLTRDFHNFRVIIFIIIIRASVDALCRDGTSEISRDPRTKRLQIRRESLARPSKHTNNNF